MIGTIILTKNEAIEILDNPSIISTNKRAVILVNISNEDDVFSKVLIDAIPILDATKSSSNMKGRMIFSSLSGAKQCFPSDAKLAKLSDLRNRS